MGQGAYSTFSLYDFFSSPNVKLYLGAFSILSLTGGFSIPSYTVLYLSLPQFSFSSLLFHSLCVEEFTEGLGRQGRLPSAPSKGTLSWSLSRERVLSSYINPFFPLPLYSWLKCALTAVYLSGVISSGCFVILIQL